MNRLFLLGCCCAAVSLTGCAGNGAVAEAPVTPAPQAATANLMDASGQMAGTARVEQMDADGAAIVVHAQADDYRTDPSGASGARIACGVLR